MGQGEVFKFLKENKDKWFSTKEVIDGLKTGSPISVGASLRKLRSKNEILCTKKIRIDSKTKSKRSVFVYKFKN